MDSIITQVLTLITGFGIFITACEMMSENLEAISSSKLKKLFEKVSNNKLTGVAIGAIATALIQSSSATTVMTIGFVNAGIVSLSQAASIIFGSEIGTTITGQIVALGMFKGAAGVSVSTILAALAGIGVVISMTAKKDDTKKIGSILTGIGLLFMGVSTMSGAMNGFAQSEAIKVFLSRIDNIILLIVLGAILTAIIQSSSAMTSIAIAMVVSGLITLEQGIYITLGANVGTCITGTIAGLSAKNINAKRTALLQLIFNIGGVVLVAVIDSIIKAVSGNSMSFGIMFADMYPGIPQTQLAMFHTLFNIASVILVLPISQYLVELTKLIIKDSDNEEEELHFYYINKHMLSTPVIAIQQMKKEIDNMSKIAIGNFNLAIDMVTSLDLEKKEDFYWNEDELNFINQNIGEYVIELSKTVTNDNDTNFLSTTFRTVSDLERIGDYSKNIVEYAESLKENNESFSDGAIGEITEMSELINKLYKSTMRVYNDSSDVKNFDNSLEIEADVDALEERMERNHIERMNTNHCSIFAGTRYLKLAADAERIADHLIDINERARKYML